MTLKSSGLIAAIAVAPIAAAAAPSMTDAEVQTAYSDAFQARMGGRPDIAEAILEDLVAARPNAPQLRLDLGVSQAEQGRCVDASRTFARGEQLARTPSFTRAVDAAMEDLCPRLAPFVLTGGIDLLYDTNVNGGSSSSVIDVYGVPVSLSGDAVAQESFGYVASGRFAYNFQLAHAWYIVPTISGTFFDYQGSDYDQLTVSPSVNLRYRGDWIDWRAGPTFLAGFDTDGHRQTGFGVQARADIDLSPATGIYVGASYLSVDDQVNSLDDYGQASVGVRLVHALGIRDMVASAGLFFDDRDYDADLQDIWSLRAEIGLQGSLTNQIGFDVGLSRTWSQGSVVHPFFGVKRDDAIWSASANLSFAMFEGVLGRPYVGVTYVISESSFGVKDYDRTIFNVGLTYRF